MITPHFPGLVIYEDGIYRIHRYNEEAYQKWLCTLQSGEVVEVVKDRRKQRSLKQNNYYWGVVLRILCEELGYFDDEMDELLRFKFLRYQTEDGLEGCYSTKDLNTRAKEYYLSQVRMWASAEHGIIIPLPNENLDWVNEQGY
jgi:hypothetical protein